MRHAPFANARRAAGLCLGLGVVAGPALAAPERYEIDPAHLSIGFLVHHIGYADTLGMFLQGEGGFSFDAEALTLSDLAVTIRADSVFTNHDRRDGHLRGGDFLDVESYPEITFVGTQAAPVNDRTGQVTGDLTILGVTRPVTLDVTWNKSAPYPFGDSYVMGVSARGVVRRSEFGMTYAVDNGWVGDDIEVIIELEAVRQ